MPLYEYHCRSCGQNFEELKRMEDRASASCPKCGGQAEKSLSPFAAVTGSCCSSEGDCGSPSGSCCSGSVRHSGCEGGGSCGCGG